MADLAFTGHSPHVTPHCTLPCMGVQHAMLQPAVQCLQAQEHLKLSSPSSPLNGIPAVFVIVIIASTSTWQSGDGGWGRPARLAGTMVGQ